MMRRSQQTHDSVNARPREVSSRPMADGVIMNAPVRVATIDDAPGIAKVLVDGWQSTYSGILPAAFLDSFRYETHAAGTRQHLQDLPSSVAVFVAEAENRIVGERVDDFGGVQVTSVAYGWRDLDAFGQRLQSTLRRAAVRPSDSEMRSDPRLT